MCDLIWKNISDIEAIISILAMILRGIGIIVVATSGLVISILKLKLKCNQYKYLNLVVDSQTRQAMKYYIPTRAQNIDPCTEEEYHTRHSFISIELLPFFINEVFKKEEIQYFIILADSGMGKTTFLLKLFFEYYKKIFRKHEIVYIPLSLESSIERIREVNKKSNTILLLDAFDEDRLAAEDYSKRLNTICKETETFYKVIMTCRTQFFPDSKSEPQYTGKIKFGVGNKSVEFIKYYISPFSDKDIKKYLKKKYRPLHKRKMREEAEELVLRCPKLMMRPMLLNYIDYLLNSDCSYEYTHQIYEVMVNKWIERESIPYDELYSFTKQLALLMFREKQYLRASHEFERICKEFDLKMSPIEAKSRSLLNRNAKGLYKFAHKSIYEYVLSKTAFDNIAFRKELLESDFVGMDMAKLFYKEMCEDYIKKREYNDLSYMLISDCVLENYDFTNCNIENCTFLDAKISNSLFVLSKAKGAIFKNCKLETVSFEGADLTRAVFSGTILSNCRFTGAILIQSDFRNTPEKDTIIEEKCDFVNANLYRSNFSGVNMSNMSCLKDANLKGINMTGALLVGIDFLCGKKLSASILKNARIYDCKMINVDFDDSDFSNAEVTNVLFTNSYFIDAILDNSLFVNVNFDNAVMAGADLRHSQFDDCTFLGTNLKDADISEGKLEKCKFYNNILDGLEMRFTERDMCNMDIKAEDYFNSKAIEDKKKVAERNMKYIMNK